MIHLPNLIAGSGLDLNVEAQTVFFCRLSPQIAMHQGKLVFAQLMLYLPLNTFRRCVADHHGEHKINDFSCLDQLFAMELCPVNLPRVPARLLNQLRVKKTRLQHICFRRLMMSRKTLPDVRSKRLVFLSNNTLSGAKWKVQRHSAIHFFGLLYLHSPEMSRRLLKCQ